MQNMKSIVLAGFYALECARDIKNLLDKREASQSELEDIIAGLRRAADLLSQVKVERK